MDVCLLIKQRLAELGLEQKDLASAAEVTESYISQVLTRKKLPPAPDRTDIYEKMAKFLKLPSDRLAKVAAVQRTEELKRNLADPPAPLFKEVRELILRKWVPDREKEIRAILGNQRFGELERPGPHKLLDDVKRIGFNGKRPTAIYYYRELQNLRDPLHFAAENRSSKKDSSGGPK